MRTNPVTGWKSVFALGPFPKVVNELLPEESEGVLRRFLGVVYENHDLTVRFKWRGVDDVGKCTITYSFSFLLGGLED